MKATIARLTDLQPEQIYEDGFLDMYKHLFEHPYVASAWLFDLDGSLVDSSQTIAGEKSAEDLSTVQMRGALDSLHVDLLSAQQRTALLVASAIQREGAHNDVFGYIVREVRNKEELVVGFIGVAYDVSQEVGSPGVEWITAVLLTVVSLTIYWGALPIWVFMDAKVRGERAVAWAVFVLIGNFVALLGYILSRRISHKHH